MTTNQKNKLLERQNPNIIGGCVGFFFLMLEWLEGAEMKKESTRKKYSSAKDARKANEKATKPAREKA